MKGKPMKFQTRCVRALAAVALSASLALTACGGGGGSSASEGGGDMAITFLPKNLGNPYFDTSGAGGEKAIKEFGGTYDGRSRHRHPRLAGAVHQHCRPAGRGRADRLANDPKAMATR